MKKNQIYMNFLILLIILFISSKVFGYENSGNRYGIDTSHGPYTDQNTFCPTNCGQCTAFAWGRALDRLGIVITFSQSTGRHACTWPDIITNTNIEIVDDYTKPKKNSLVIWGSESICDESNPGHVAYQHHGIAGRLYSLHKR